MKQKLLFLMCACLLSLSGWAQDDPLSAMQQDAEGFYLLNSLDDWKALYKATNEGTTNINVRMTADIAGVTENEMIPFYSGHFDGQYHTLTVNINYGSDDAAPFAILQEGAIVENLHTTGVVNSSAKYCTGLCAEQYASTIRNVVTTVEINCTFHGDATFGGLAGKVWGTSVYENCVFAGKVNAPNAWCWGSLSAYERAGGSQFINCLAINDDVDISIESNNNWYATREKVSAGAYVNNYYTENEKLRWPPFGTNYLITHDQLESGEVCMLLNGQSDEPVYFQNLGEDKFPWPFKTRKQVYTTAPQRCDGQLLGQGEYTNDASQVNRPDHNYQEGFCTECGGLDKNYLTPDETNTFTLTGAADLEWFIAYVNQVDNSVSARLTADADISDKILAFAIFTGTFDGQGHKITYRYETADEYAGLFLTLAAAGTVKNLTVDGSVTTSNKFAGGLAGNLLGRVENCVSLVTINSSVVGDGTHGGFAGRTNGGSINNSISAAKFNGGGTNCWGGFIGWCDGAASFNHCLSAVDLLAADQNGSQTFARNGTICSYKDCYYVTEVGGTGDAPSAQRIAADALGSGAACWLMNGNSFRNPVFFQNVGDDPAPLLDSSHGIVYPYDGQYADVRDEASYQEFVERFITSEQNIVKEALAEKALIDAYAEMISGMTNIPNMARFADAYANAEALKRQVESSIAAYAAYQKKVGETYALLNQEPEKTSDLRNLLLDYLEGDVFEPSDRMPNGSYGYIIANHVMSEAQLKEEIAWLDKMWRRIVNSEYAVGSDVTNLLANADFSEGFAGWQGKVGTGYGTSPNNSMRAAECWNNTMDMYQTVTELAPGIYELQVNGANRPYPYENRSNTNLGAMLYLNGNQNYFMANIEGMIPAAEAVDGQNCNLTGEYPDFSVTDIEGNLQGYIMHGIVGCCNAFQAGRYPNSILVQVGRDGELKVGLKLLSSGNPEDWLGFGNIHLFYRGELENATEAIDRVLAGQVARANTLIAYQCDDVEYTNYPNYAKSIRDELSATVAAAGTAADNAQKYALIEKFSELFQQVYDCKQAYISMLNYLNKIQMFVDATLNNYMTDAQKNEFVDIANNVWDSANNGTASVQDALDNTEIQKLSFFKQISGLEPAYENGYYQITSAEELLWYSLATNTNGGLNALLKNDIDMSSLIAWNPIANNTNFTGTFDGQGFTISNFSMDCKDGYGGFVRQMNGSGTVKNFTLKGKMTISEGATVCGAVVGFSYEGRIDRVFSYVDITATGVTGSFGGIIGGGTADYNNEEYSFCHITDCSYNGTMDIQGCSGNFGGIVGGDYTLVDKEMCRITNCANYGTITADNDSPSIGGIAGTVNSPRYPGIRYCLNVGKISRATGGQTGGFVGSLVAWNLAKMVANYWLEGSATIGTGNNEPMQLHCVTQEQVENGYTCFALNKNQETTHWYQTIGVDPYPVLEPTHGVVVQEDGKYVNEGADARIPLITSVAQLSSNASDTVEGQNIGALIDGDVNTFWHTDWHNWCTDQYHYLQVALNEPFTGEITAEMTRRNSATNDHPTEMKVWGSFDGETFFDVTTIHFAYDGPGTVATAESFSLREPVKYLRFAASDCVGEAYGYRTFWHAAEFQLYGISGTSVESVAAPKAVKAIYNLQGQKVQKATKGLYIIDGKVVLVK